MAFRIARAGARARRAALERLRRAAPGMRRRRTAGVRRGVAARAGAHR